MPSVQTKFRVRKILGRVRRIIDVPNLDVALEWAARHPAAGFASIEVRPLLGSHFMVGTPKPPK